MRKATPKKRVVLPDPVFNEVKVTKFVNHLMYDGKKSIALTLTFQPVETTFSDQDIETLMTKVEVEVKKKFPSAQLRDA